MLHQIPLYQDPPPRAWPLGKKRSMPDCQCHLYCLLDPLSLPFLIFEVDDALLGYPCVKESQMDYIGYDRPCLLVHELVAAGERYAAPTPCTFEFRISLSLSFSIMVARSHSSPSRTFHPSFARPLDRSAVLEKGRGKPESFCEGTKTNSLFLPFLFPAGGGHDDVSVCGPSERRRGRPTDQIKKGRKASLHPEIDSDRDS